MTVYLHDDAEERPCHRPDLDTYAVCLGGLTITESHHGVGHGLVHQAICTGTEDVDRDIDG